MTRINSRDRKLIMCALAIVAALAAIVLGRGLDPRPRGISITLVPVQRVQTQEQEAKLESDSEVEARFASGQEDDPYERERWFWEQRAYPLRTVPAKVHWAAIQAESA